MHMSSGSESSSPASDTSELSSASSSTDDEPEPEPDTPSLALASAWGPPTLTIAQANQDERDEIQYIMEDFPQDLSCLAEHYQRDPIYVKGGDRVRVLAFMENYAVRIRREANGSTGLVPAWNLEDPHERLARLNMEYNEALACPNEQIARRSREAASAPRGTLQHVHADCPPQNEQSRRRFVSEGRRQAAELKAQGRFSVFLLPDTPEVDSGARVRNGSAASVGAMTDKEKKARSVVFAGTQDKVFHRYLIPVDFNKKRRRFGLEVASEDAETRSPTPAEEEEDTAWPWEVKWTETAEDIARAKAVAEEEAALAAAEAEARAQKELAELQARNRAARQEAAAAQAQARVALLAAPTPKTLTPPLPTHKPHPSPPPSPSYVQNTVQIRLPVEEPQSGLPPAVVGSDSRRGRQQPRFRGTRIRGAFRHIEKHIRTSFMD
ncbi:hypothetical protein EIP91_002928 [Steccherinum ochraceum]|uniref:Uncharacterized protein n=1 Tax=Steccherinum ochraceum TaxID=92696 RepID=A0A4R0RS22_9APHY|nr:hypothetical protein EIP91_002928 [Steccherinum ochraceum]